MDVVTYILSKKYTNLAIEGLTQIKGADCRIKSIDVIEGGHRITFSWIGSEGTELTEHLDVMDGVKGDQGEQGEQGEKGEQGVSIVSIAKTGSTGKVDTYTITLSDGSTTTFTVTNGVSEVQINDFSSLVQLEDYLYKITYDNLDEEFAEEYFRTHTIHLGACSSVRKGNLYGRNYDWYYDNAPDFVVTVPAINKKHASIAVCPGFGELTNEKVKSRSYSELYKIVPFLALDGINDAGVVCNINVVPAGDWGTTTGTTPAIELRKSLNTHNVLRFVLDNFATATDAVNYLKNYCSIKMVENTETHYMIADSSKTYVIEFIENALEILDVTNTRPYMTNFYLKDSIFNSETGLIDRTSLTPHGSGVERYELIAKKYADIGDASDMMSLMHNDLKYTNAYDRTITDYWYTEFVGEYPTFGDITVTSPISAFEPVVEYAINEFEHRDRNTKTTWQTVHSVVYDIANKTLMIIPQEVGGTYNFSLSDSRVGKSAFEVWRDDFMHDPTLTINDYINYLTTTSWGEF